MRQKANKTLNHKVEYAELNKLVGKTRTTRARRTGKELIQKTTTTKKEKKRLKQEMTQDKIINIELNK